MSRTIILRDWWVAVASTGTFPWGFSLQMYSITESHLFTASWCNFWRSGRLYMFKMKTIITFLTRLNFLSITGDMKEGILVFLTPIVCIHWLNSAGNRFTAWRILIGGSICIDGARCGIGYHDRLYLTKIFHCWCIYRLYLTDTVHR